MRGIYDYEDIMFFQNFNQHAYSCLYGVKGGKASLKRYIEEIEKIYGKLKTKRHIVKYKLTEHVMKNNDFYEELTIKHKRLENKYYQYIDSLCPCNSLFYEEIRLNFGKITEAYKKLKMADLFTSKYLESLKNDELYFIDYDPTYIKLNYLLDSSQCDGH
jgi:hypothetical protein